MRVTLKGKEGVRGKKTVLVFCYQDNLKEAWSVLSKNGIRSLTALKSFSKELQFKGQKGKSLYLPGLKTPTQRIFLSGLGKKKDFDLESLRVSVGRALRDLESKSVKEVSILLDSLSFEGSELEDAVAAISEASFLVTHSFNKYKKGSEKNFKLNQVAIIAGKSAGLRKAIEKGKAIGLSICGVRDYGLEPSNYFTPALYADSVRKTAREISLNCEVLTKPKIKSLKMGGVLGVAQGSVNDPRFVVLKHRPRGAKKHICLVGKGVTFDTGGISLKPANKMDRMKYDMLGSATAIQITFAAKRLNLPINITTLTPMVENMPGGNAINPGDILKMMSGATVEVLNTDAEGRLILADALHYAKKFKPDHCVDFATLTGAVSVALGNKAIGLMGKDQNLVDDLISAGEAVRDRCWQLPLWEDYEDEMKSSIADYKNISETGSAGTITAGSFLSFFIEGVSWAHLDIAGTAWKEGDAGYIRKGPSGAGVRMMVNWLESLCK